MTYNDWGKMYALIGYNCLQRLFAYISPYCLSCISAIFEKNQLSLLHYS
jgi:hypothetical protein